MTLFAQLTYNIQLLESCCFNLKPIRFLVRQVFLSKLTTVFCFPRADLSNAPVLLGPARSGAAVALQHFEGLLASRPGGGVLPRPQLCSRHFAASHGRGRGVSHAQVSDV